MVMYGCESWIVKKAEHRRIDAFELWCWRRLLRVPWTARTSNQSILKEIDQSWVFIGRTDAEAETPILWPSHVKSWLIGKDPDAGKDWGQEKGTTKDEMAGWHHWLDGHGFEWTPGVGDGQGGLACCDSWGCKESDMTRETELNWISNHSIIFKTVNKKLLNFIHCFNHKVDFLVDSTMPMKNKQLHFDANSNSGSKE